LVKDIPDLEDPQRRVMGMALNDMYVLNVYVPNGESVDSPKYQYKLGWLQKLHDFLADTLKKYSKVIVLGDFNIAPEAQDVYDPAAWVNSVLFSEKERAALYKLMELGVADCFRLHPQPEKSYSWWDYRLNAFKRNMGLRIDHILASRPLAAECLSCYIDKAPRAAERPSDHAPVVAEFSA
jgi:exodeoxyribonuclease-3